MNTPLSGTTTDFSAENTDVILLQYDFMEVVTREKKDWETQNRLDPMAQRWGGNSV